MSNQLQREWIYRMAFEVGRHIIAFEVQKILAAVDWFDGQNEADLLPLGQFGYGEGERRCRGHNLKCVLRHLAVNRTDDLRNCWRSNDMDSW